MRIYTCERTRAHGRTHVHVCKRKGFRIVSRLLNSISETEIKITGERNVQESVSASSFLFIDRIVRKIGKIKNNSKKTRNKMLDK